MDPDRIGMIIMVGIVVMVVTDKSFEIVASVIRVIRIIRVMG